MQIKKLSPLLANQIAAGEVVERPSSVVKELLENAVDAGAKRIQVDIERGGARLIRVIDDGHGIAREQLELALARHATSKIEQTDDLKAIHTLGFRGEALASISSVAKLTLSSKRIGSKSSSLDNDASGWSAIAQGQDMAVEIQPRSMPVGTIVEVRDLFFNTPARQKFLRAERTEYVHIEETLKRVALASPQVAFTLKHNGKVTKRIPAAESQEQQKQRVGTIVSNNFLSHSYFLDSKIGLDSKVDGLRLWGWLSSPQHHQNSNLSQYVFVNGRAVRDRTLNHAIRQAYSDLLPTGRVPAFVLYLELEAEQVDVNVHPTKHEVRFSDGRQVHDFIAKAVAERLEAQNQLLDASELHHVEEVKGSYQPSQARDEYYHPRLAAGVAAEQPAEKSVVQNRQSSGQERHYHSYAPKTPSKSSISGDYIIIDQQYLIQPQATGADLLDIKSFWLDYMSQLLQQEWNIGEVKQRPLLIPERLGLPEDELSQDRVQMWAELGFDLNMTGPKSVALRRVPSCIEHIDSKQWVQDCLYHQSSAKSIGDKDVNGKALQQLLLSRVADYWQPQTNTLWMDVLQSLGWQQSNYCQQLQAEDIAAWLLHKSKSGQKAG